MQSQSNVLETLQDELKTLKAEQLLREALSDSDLPGPAKRKIREQFDGKPFDQQAVDTAIRAAEASLDPFASDGNVYLPGQERNGPITLGESTQDKLMLALDGFWAGEDLKLKDGTPVKRFSCLGDAYEAITRRRFNPSQAIKESTGWDPKTGHRYDSAGRDTKRMAEAIQTASWGQVLGDSLTRRMLAEYRRPDLQTWRQMCSDISNVKDFRLQRRMRVGGYGLLPTVAEGQTYTALQSPEDEEGTYQLVKKGGLEMITMEALAADSDVGALRRTPQRMGRAAALTLHRQIFDMFRLNQALTLTNDTTNLFTAGHGNSSTGLALDAAGLNAGILAMKSQLAYGDATDVLGLVPKFIMHAAALAPMVYQLLQTPQVPQSTDWAANQFLQYRIQPIEITYWPATLWVLCASPQDISTFEIGFFRGQEEPELFEASAENVEGSQFYSDQVSYKVRFAFGSLIGDHRAFYANL